VSPPERDSIEVVLESKVEAVLESMLGRLLRVERLASGTTGTSYVVETKAGRVAAKLFAADSQSLLGPEPQHALLELLAETGIAPRPLGFNAEVRLLVTEYLGEAAPVAPEVIRSGERVADLVAGLRQLHRELANVPRFDPAADAARYLESIGGVSSLGRRDRDRFDELLELAGSLGPGASLEPGAVLCHNDLVASNLLFDHRLRFIDFDYAVLAAPALDLASVTVMNDFSDVEAARLLEAYYDGAGPLSLAEFARVQRLVRLLAHFWALASANASAAIVGQYRIRHD
jgi:thiamine kinase-like enzyme